MILSLEILQRELHFMNLNVSISASPRRSVRTVQLYSPRIREPREDVLYLAGPEDVARLCERADICLLICGEVPENAAFSYLALPSDALSLAEAGNLVLDIFSRYNEMEQQFLRLIASGKSLQDMVNLLADFFQNPVYMIDAGYKLLAMNADPELPYLSITLKRLKERGYMPLNTIMSLLGNHEWQTPNPENQSVYMMIPEFYCPFLRCEYRAENILQGYLFVIGLHRQIDPEDRLLLDLWRPYIDHYFSRYIEKNSFKGLYHEHFFCDVIADALKDEQRIQEQLHPLGWNCQDLYCVLFISLNDSVSPSIQGVLFRSLTQLRGGKPFRYKEDLYCVFRLDSPGQLEDLKKELKNLLQQISIKAGLSDAFRGFPRMSRFSKQAILAEHTGTQLHPEEYLYAYGTYVLPHLYRICREQMEMESFIHEAIPFLDTWDKKHHTQYLKTLQTFLHNECSLVKTAQALFIHRNTLVYRINQIRELTEADLEDWNIRLRLLLSIEIYLSQN